MFEDLGLNTKVAGSVSSGLTSQACTLEKRYYIPVCFRVTASAISELYVNLGEGVSKTEGKHSQPCLAKSLTNVPIKRCKIG